MWIISVRHGTWPMLIQHFEMVFYERESDITIRDLQVSRALYCIGCKYPYEILKETHV
jgi:hypothetical protein